MGKKFVPDHLRSTFPVVPVDERFAVQRKGVTKAVPGKKRKGLRGPVPKKKPESFVNGFAPMLLTADRVEWERQQAERERAIRSAMQLMRESVALRASLVAGELDETLREVLELHAPDQSLNAWRGYGGGGRELDPMFHCAECRVEFPCRTFATIVEVGSDG